MFTENDAPRTGSCKVPVLYYEYFPGGCGEKCTPPGRVGARTSPTTGKYASSFYPMEYFGTFSSTRRRMVRTLLLSSFEL